MSRKISPEVLTKLKGAVDILEVVGEHVVLRKAGREYVGLCPFHNERSGSFYVNAEKQVYHCHGCHASGDSLRFIQEIHGVSFPEALREMAERARIALPKEEMAAIEGGGSPEEIAARNARLEKVTLATKLNRFVAEFYFHRLKDHRAASEYVNKRGLTPDWIRQFYVGFAAKEWDKLGRHLAEKKAPLPLAEELGLIRKSTRQSQRPGDAPHFDLFRNRIMFPILDTRGRVVGFGGRTLPGGDDSADPNAPKYLNSPESLLFKKSKIAYGLFQAQKHVREKDEVVFVEGYFDVIALHTAGFANAVATCGTSLTPEHIQTVQRFGKKLTLLFDADKAGEAATLRAMELGLEHGLVFHGATLPQGRDPDEILFDATGMALESGREQMSAILQNAEPLLDTCIAQALSPQAMARNEDKVAGLKQVAGWLHQFKDELGRAVRVETLREKYGVSGELLLKLGLAGQAVAQRSAPQVVAPRGGPQPNPPSGGPPSLPRRVQGRPPSGNTARGAPSRLSEREKLLLQGFALGGAYTEALALARKELPEGWTLAHFFDYPPASEWVRRLAEEPGLWDRFRNAPATAMDPDMDRQVLSTFAEVWVVGGAIPGAAAQGPGQEAFDMAVKRSLARAWARFSQTVRTALADAEAKKDAGLETKLMKDYLDVQRKLKEFTAFYDEAQ